MQVRVKFKLQDFWVGVYWDKRVYREYDRDNYPLDQNEYHVYICLVPCFPICLTYKGAKPNVSTH